MRARFRRLIVGLWLPVGALALWEGWSYWGGNPFFPAPHVIVSTAVEAFSQDTIFEHIVATLSLFTAGFLGGGTLGIAVGAALGSHEPSYRLFSPIAVFLRSTPTAAKLPVILAILGIGSNTLYVAVTLAVFLNVVVVTMIGVGRVDKTVLETARVLSLGRIHQVFLIRLMAAAGDVLMGLQTALQTGLLVTALAELLISSRGLGAFLRDSQQTFQLEQMWLSVFLLGIIGLVANEGFRWLERRATPWYFKSRQLGSQ